MITGNNAVLQIGLEDTYGTADTATQEIRFISESVRKNLNKKDEGVLTGGRAISASATLSKNTSGNLQFLARPDDIGFVLGGMCGVEASPAAITPSITAYRHTFTAMTVDETTHLPAFTALIDRVNDVYTYAGLKFDSVTLAAAPEDFLKVDASVVGMTEAGGGTLEALTPSTLKAFRFAWGAVTFDGDPVGDITNVKLTYNNNLVKNVQTTGTGYYFYEPDPAARDIQIEMEVLYGAVFDDFDTVYGDDSVVEIVLTFTSEEEADDTNNIPYKLTITIPNAQVIDAVANISSPDVVKAQIKTKAVEVGTDELIEIELDNLRSTKYIA